MAADGGVCARFTVALAKAAESGDYTYAEYMRQLAEELAADAERRVAVRAAIAVAYADGDGARVRALSDLLQRGNEGGTEWRAKARQLLGPVKEELARAVN